MMTEYRDKRDSAGQSGTCPGQICRDGRDTTLGSVPVVPLARMAADLVPMPLFLSGPETGGMTFLSTHTGGLANG